MVLVNYTTRELTAKLVYYGPGLCGKTTNLQYVFDNLLPVDKRGKMVSLSTETDRTLFFDFLPLEIGTIRGLKTRLQLYTVPGQVHYNATRKIVLKGADGIVFVADSQASAREKNLESYKNMKANLLEHGLDLQTVPHVFQFNKRDLPDVMSLEQMESDLNEHNVPFFEASAVLGVGVEDTLKAITRIVLKNLAQKFQSDVPAEPAAAAPAAVAAAPAVRPAPPVAATLPPPPAAARRTPPLELFESAPSPLDGPGNVFSGELQPAAASSDDPFGAAVPDTAAGSDDVEVLEVGDDVEVLEVGDDVEVLEVGDDVEVLEVGDDVEVLEVGDDVEVLEVGDDALLLDDGAATDEPFGADPVAPAAAAFELGDADWDAPRPAVAAAPAGTDEDALVADGPMLSGDTVMSPAGEMQGLPTEADLQATLARRKAAGPPAPFAAPAAPAPVAPTPAPVPAVAAPASVPAAAVPAATVALVLPLSLGEVSLGDAIDRSLEIPVDFTDASGVPQRLTLQVNLRFRVTE